MLHNEARNLLVEAYEKTHDAKGIALAYGVSVPTVYRDDPCFGTGASPMYRPRENNGEKSLVPSDLLLTHRKLDRIMAVALENKKIQKNIVS